MFIGIK